MASLSCTIRPLWQCASLFCTLILDATRWLWLCRRSPAALAAENLFLRKQLALYQERHVTPRRATNATRLALVWLSRWFNWRQALAVVQPDTFIRWHRQGVRLFWRWKSTPGRPPIPADLQALIRRIARENPTWGQERIANELLLKLGLRVLRRECLDFVTPLTEHHLRRIIPIWTLHYNGGRPHMALGPGIPQPSASLPVALQAHRHRLPAHGRVVTRPILGGLHRDYRREEHIA